MNLWFKAILDVERNDWTKLSFRNHHSEVSVKSPLEILIGSIVMYVFFSIECHATSTEHDIPSSHIVLTSRWPVLFHTVLLKQQCGCNKYQFWKFLVWPARGMGPNISLIKGTDVTLDLVHNGNFCDWN